MKKLIHEIHRRSLWQVLGIYVVGGWVALTAVDTLAGALGLPEWAPRFATFLLIIGLPIVLATAFVQEGVGRRDTADESSGDLETTAGGTPIPPAAAVSGDASQRLFTWRNAAISGIAAFALWGIISAAWVLLGFRPPTKVDEAAADPATPAIAVMPFTIRGEGLEVWREGMVDALSTNLTDVAGLRAINSRTVLARWKEQVGEGEEADLARVLTVAERAGARYALMGNAIEAGPRVRFSADLYDVDSEQRLEHVQVEGPPDDVLALVDELALGVVRALVSGEFDLPRFDLAGVTTESVDALKAFLVGEAHYRRSDFEAAIESYEEAVAIDSMFALAALRLADSQGYSTFNRTEALDRAQKYKGRLPEREQLLLMALEDQSYGHIETFDTLRAFLRRHPDDAEAWFYLGELYMHAPGRVLATADDAQKAFARVVSLTPEFGPAYVHLIDLADFIQADSTYSFALRADQARIGHVDKEAELAAGLIFGNATTRREILASLDTVPINEIWDLHEGGMTDPRNWDVLEPVLLTQYERADETRNPDGSRSAYAWSLATSAALNAGQLDKALAYMDEPEIPTGSRTCATALIVVGELPVPEEFRDATLRPYTEGTDSWYCFAALAAASGEWHIHGDALKSARTSAAEARTSGDSAGAADTETSVLVLEAYGLRSRGDLTAALGLLESDPGSLRYTFGRWLQARLYNELGRPRDAIPILLSFWPGYGRQTKYVALANRELGRAYEAIGEDEKAIAAYANFIDAWQNADPELQPWVDDAQVRMDALWAKRN